MAEPHNQFDPSIGISAVEALAVNRSLTQCKHADLCQDVHMHLCVRIAGTGMLFELFPYNK